jgi:hypothetical protein
MLASLGFWLSQLSPNIAVPLVVSALIYGYHALLSPAAQAKIAAAVNDAMELAQKAIDAALALAPAGTTAAQLEGDLLNVAKAQLAHAGFDPSKLPPIVLSLVQALVNVALAQWQASQPVTVPAPVPVPVPVSAAPAQPQAVPIVAIPPAPPSGAKGAIRPQLALLIAATLTTAGVALPYGCGGKSVGTVVLQTGQCVLDSGVEATVLADLATESYAALLASLATTVAPTLIDCALKAIASGSGAPTDAGPTSLAVDLRVARAQQILAAGGVTSLKK